MEPCYLGRAAVWLPGLCLALASDTQMFAKLLYVQVRENQFTLRNIDGPRTSERTAAHSFSHPRMLVGDFTAAQACLKGLLSEAQGSGFVLSTSVVIHPLEKIDGGLSQVEERLFQELAAGAGAIVWVGAPLSDAEVIAKVKGR